MHWIYAFSQSPYDWQRNVITLLQPRDACRFTACCANLSDKKKYITELHRIEIPLWCAICENVLCHPYRLSDCGHVVCGRCIYDKLGLPSMSIGVWRCQHPVTGWKRSCNITVRKRPQKLGADYCSQEDLDAAAAAAMPLAKMREHWKAWHNNIVLVGTEDDFGVSVFDNYGFPGDFDDLPHANYRNLAKVLPAFLKYSLIIYPAKQNFNGVRVGTRVHVGTLDEFDRQDATRSITDLVLLEGIGMDDVLLVTDFYNNNGNPLRGIVEFVVTGWEGLVTSFEKVSVAFFRELAAFLPAQKTYKLAICKEGKKCRGGIMEESNEFDSENATDVVIEVVMLQENLGIDDVLLVTEMQGLSDETSNLNDSGVEVVVVGWGVLVPRNKTIKCESGS